MPRNLHGMVNPSVMQQFAKERGAEILEASQVPRAPRSRRVRQRVGWSLIGVGARLALSGPPRHLHPLTRP